jgi:hypothetical protein
MKQIARTLTIAGLLIVGALATQPAHAIVPPKNCGNIKVKHHPYHINADQIPCKRARSYSSAWLGSHKRPPHFKCVHNKGTSLIYKCVNKSASPDQTIFIIDLKYKG